MPRKTSMTPRSFEEIFQQAKLVGAENVFVTDDEQGIVRTGGATPAIKGSTIAGVAKSEFRCFGALIAKRCHA